MISREDQLFVSIAAAGAIGLAALATFAALSPTDDLPLALLVAAPMICIAALWRTTVEGSNPIRWSLLGLGLVVTSVALGNVLLGRGLTTFTVNLAAAPAVGLLGCWMVTRESGRRLFVTGCAALLIVLSFYALSLWIGGAPTGVATDLGDGGFTRRIFPASFGHPNQFAATLGLLLPVVLASAIRPGGPAIRIALFAATLTGLMALALTYSRAVWIAAAVAMAVVCLSGPIGRKLALLGAVAMAALSAPIVERLTTTDLGGGRIDIWQEAIAVVAENPVVGVGVGNFPAHVDVVLPNSAGAPPHAHNLFLATATELGAPVAIALMLALGALVYSAVRGSFFRESADPGLAFGLLGSLLILLVGGLFDTVVFHNVPTLMIAALLVGASAGIHGPPAAHRGTRPRLGIRAALRGGPESRFWTSVRSRRVVYASSLFVLASAPLVSSAPDDTWLFVAFAAMALVLLIFADELGDDRGESRGRSEASGTAAMALRLALAAGGAAAIVVAADLDGRPDAAALVAVLYFGLSLDTGFLRAVAWLRRPAGRPPDHHVRALMAPARALAVGVALSLDLGGETLALILLIVAMTEAVATSLGLWGNRRTPDASGAMSVE